MPSSFGCTVIKSKRDIQSDSGRKANILGGDSIGHCERKSAREHVSDSEWLTRYSCLNLQIQKHCEWINYLLLILF